MSDCDRIASLEISLAKATDRIAALEALIPCIQGEHNYITEYGGRDNAYERCICGKIKQPGV